MKLSDLPPPPPPPPPPNARITSPIPVDPVHGMRKGRVLLILRPSDTIYGAVVVMGDAGEEVTLLRREHERTSDPVGG